MPAVVRASIFTGPGATPASAETGIKYNRDGTQLSASNPIPRPSLVGTNYSWSKVIALEVTTPDITSISNRRVSLLSALVAGLTLWQKNIGGAYAESASVTDNLIANDAAPAGYSATTTVATPYDSSSITANSGRNGSFLSFVLGVSNNYVSGAGSAVALPSLVLSYDEI